MRQFQGRVDNQDIEACLSVDALGNLSNHLLQLLLEAVAFFYGGPDGEIVAYNQQELTLNMHRDCKLHENYLTLLNVGGELEVARYIGVARLKRHLIIMDPTFTSGVYGERVSEILFYLQRQHGHAEQFEVALIRRHEDWNTMSLYIVFVIVLLLENNTRWNILHEPPSSLRTFGAALLQQKGFSLKGRISRLENMVIGNNQKSAIQVIEHADQPNAGQFKRTKVAVTLDKEAMIYKCQFKQINE